MNYLAYAYLSFEEQDTVALFLLHYNEMRILAKPFLNDVQIFAKAQIESHQQ
jgi:hypothetical protein